MAMGIGQLSGGSKKSRVKSFEVKLIAGTNSHAQIAIGTRGEIFNGRILAVVESEHSGGTDPHTRTTPVTKAPIDDLGKPPQSAGELPPLREGPCHGLYKGAPLA